MSEEARRRSAPAGPFPTVPFAPLLLATLLLLSLDPWAVPVAAQEGSAFTVDDAVDLADVSSPRLSPDGTRVLFVRTDLDWEENERKDRIWIAGADGEGARPYTAEEGDGSPAWSPDGQRIAFLRTTGEGDDRARQIFLLHADGGEARPLTSHPTSVERFEWADDGESLVFLADDSLATEERERREKGYDHVFVNEGPHGQRRGSWNGVWRVEADPDSADPRKLTPGEIRVGSFALSPEGDRLAYTFRTENRRNDPYLSEIALAGLETGEVEVLTDNEAPESDLAWSPDGRLLTFTAPDLETWELAQGNLYALEVATGEIRELSQELEAALRSYRWHPDGEAIELLAMERTDGHLFRLDLSTGEVRRVSHEPGVISSPSYSADHRRVAFVHSTPTSPGQVRVSSTEAFDPSTVTNVNPALAARDLSTPEVIRWRSRDGLEIEGLLHLPSGEDAGPRPLVLHIHGGPAGVFSRSFSSDVQLLTAHGYAVLQPNVRGSTGYGDELLRGNMYDIGGGDYHDLMTGVDHVLEAGVAHPDSLAVKGWSYGGILGGWTLTRTDRFQAASLGAMVSDWRSEFGAGFHFDVARWYLGGDPWSNKELWIERSPYTHADRVTTPTLLFHGEADRVDTEAQSMNFFAALEHHGVEARYVFFPREGHGIREPRHQRVRWVEEVRWFQHHVRGEEDWHAPVRTGEDEAPDPEAVAEEAESG